MNYLYGYLYGWLITFVAVWRLDGDDDMFRAVVSASVRATAWPVMVPAQMVLRLFTYS